MKQAREITPQGLRNMRIRLSPMPQGGWHFSYFGGAEQVKRKLECMADQQVINPEHSDIEFIRKGIESGKGLFPADGQPLAKVDASLYPVEMLKLFPKSWWLP